MADGTGIQWCDATWNVVAGCLRLSPGCDRCYALRESARLAGNPNEAIQAAYRGTVERRASGRLDWTGEVRTLPARLDWPLRRQKPRRIFVCSTADLFHERVPDEFIERVFGIMALCQQHTFILLTKRPERMLRWFLTDPIPLSDRATEVCRWAEHMGKIVWDPRGSDPSSYWGVAGFEPENARNRRAWPGWPLPNVWLGVTAENQEMADRRIPILLQVPAVVQWVSAEPLLGPVDLGRWLGHWEPGWCYSQRPNWGCGPTWEAGLSWCVVGGETGPGARPMHPDWVRSIRDQSTAAGVPFFLKSWGQWEPSETKPEIDTCYHKVSDGTVRGYTQYSDPPHHWWGGKWGDGKPLSVRVGRKAAGHLLDGVEWRQFPGVSSRGQA